MFSSHAITSDVSVVDTALAAEFFLTDGIILTGNATGNPADPNELNGGSVYYYIVNVL